MEGEQPVAQDLLADEPRCVGCNLIMAFAFRIDTWADDGESIVEHVADVDDLTIALATYHAACKRWPRKAITLRQGARVIEDNRRSRLAILFSFPWSDKPSP
jgi:hypothetical protein